MSRGTAKRSSLRHNHVLYFLRGGLHCTVVRLQSSRGLLGDCSLYKEWSREGVSSVLITGYLVKSLALLLLNSSDQIDRMELNKAIDGERSLQPINMLPARTDTRWLPPLSLDLSLSLFVTFPPFSLLTCLSIFFFLHSFLSPSLFCHSQLSLSPPSFPPLSSLTLPLSGGP